MSIRIQEIEYIMMILNCEISDPQIKIEAPGEVQSLKYQYKGKMYKNLFKNHCTRNVNTSNKMYI